MVQGKENEFHKLRDKAEPKKKKATFIPEID